MSVEDMKDFIESFSAIPDDPKTPFIVAHELAQNDDGTYHLSVIISSHALIDLILKDPSDKLIQVDFTHNLSVDGFLVAMVGCPNDSQEYCPICVSITTGENRRSTMDVLGWIRQNHVGCVKAVMADGAKPISVAIYKVFGEKIIRLMCYYHMRK